MMRKTTTQSVPVNVNKSSSFFNKQDGDKSVFFQPKLSIGSAGDIYEREADAVAGRIMSMNDTGQLRRHVAIPPVTVLRKCSDCEEEERMQRKEKDLFSAEASVVDHPVQRKCAKCQEEEEKRIQRKESANPSPDAPQSVYETLRSPGRPLETDIRTFMESRFGYDFSSVKIHTGSVSAKSASDVNALAYTSGNNIVFNEGQYSPSTENGQRLLAHELTHVVQQQPLEVRRTEDPEESSVTTAEELGIDTRSYAAVHSEFYGHISMGEVSAALAVAPTLIAKMQPEDARRDGAGIASFLQQHGRTDLAMTAFIAAESAWFVHYVSAEGSRFEFGRGFGTIGMEVSLVLAAARTEAHSERHDNAIRLFEMAHLMIEMQKSEVLERVRSSATDQRLSQLSPELRASIEPFLRFTRDMAVSDLRSLEEQRLTILHFYEDLAREAQEAGNAQLVTTYTELNTRLNREIVERYQLVSGLSGTDIIVDLEPAPEPAPRPASARPSAVPEEATEEHETAPVAETRVVAADETYSVPPAFNDTTVFAYTANTYGKVEAEQYMVTEVLSRAFTWATNAFGVRNAVIALDMYSDPPRYYVAPMDTEFTLADFRVVSNEDPEMPGTMLVPGLRVLNRLGATNFYTVAVIFRDVYSVPGPGGDSVGRMQAIGERLAAEHQRGEHYMDAAQVEQTIFGPIERAIADGDTGTAADLLGNLTADGFSSISWERKSQYLALLINEWTTHRRERAIIEIIKSIESRTQLDAVLAQLRDAGIYQQLFEDLDHELWTLMVEIGRKFNSGTDFTLGDFYQLLLDARLIVVAPGISLGPNGPEISIDFLAQAEEAAQSFLRFVEGIWDGIVMLITHPDKIIEGLAQLTKMIVMFELAYRFGYPPAVTYMNQVFSSIGQSVVFGMQGVQITGMGQYVVNRVKWAIIWEVASWFIGVGEITAFVRGLGSVERVAVVSRFLRILGLAGRATEAEALSARVSRVAAIMSRSSSRIPSEEHLLTLITRLPDTETRTLARLLHEGGDIPESVTDLAALATHNAELGRAASNVVERAEALQELAAKAGTMSDEVAQAFAALSRMETSAPDLRRIIDMIPADEGPRFVNAIRRIPAEAIAEGQVTRAFLEVTAASPGRMTALTNFGYNTYRKLVQHAGGDGARLDHYLDSLRRIEEAMDPERRAVEFQRLLDDVASDNPRAWTRLEDDMRSRGVEIPESAAPGRTATSVADEVAAPVDETAHAPRGDEPSGPVPAEHPHPVTTETPGAHAPDAYERGRSVEMDGHAESPDGQHHVEIYPDDTIGRCSPVAPGARCPLMSQIFREVLRERPALVRQFDELQAEIARHGDDVPDYLETQLAELEQRMRRLQAVQGTSRAPVGWRIQEVGYHNYPDTVPLHGDRTILEFPNGERVWRNADGTIVQEGTAGRRIGRQDFEEDFFTGTEMGVPGLEGYQRAHAHGQSLGWESPYALYYAPEYVNQVIQNRGIERFLRVLRDRMRPGEELIIRTEVRPHWGSRRLQTIEYHIDVVRGTERVPVYRYRIDVDNVRANPTTTATPIEFITPADPAARLLANDVQGLVPGSEMPDVVLNGVTHTGVR